MFHPLPTSMPMLEDVVRHLDGMIILPPPPILDIGLKLRKVFSRERENNYSGVTRSDLRKLPYAYWVDGHGVLADTDPVLVNKYWETILPEALSGNPRRAKRWLLPLFYTYCERFIRVDDEFSRYSKKLLNALDSSSGPFADNLKKLQNSYSFFDPTFAPNKLAAMFFLGRESSIDELLQSYHLWPGFVSSNLGTEILKSALRFSVPDRSAENTISRMMEWTRKCSAPVAKTAVRIDFANALLKHWMGNTPDKKVKNLLIKYFLEEYQDPRHPLHRQYQWAGVSEQALAVFLNWLTGDTLQAFMKLLQRTADDIWEYRQKFWMAYYNNGYIDEAWIALGLDAQYQASQLRLRDSEIGMGYGRLEGASSTNQSVLILKIGDLIFTEWSHNGSLRAYHESNRFAPKLYRKTYSATDLRAAVSLDFHNGVNVRPELTHAHSDLGSWQRKARDFIRRQTNLYLRDDLII